MNLGQAIIHLRVNRMKQTQDLFAHNVGITQTYLSQIENGKKTESDVKKKRLEAFRLLKPATDALINSFF